MSLNALGVSQLNRKAGSGAGYSFTSGAYAGVSSARYDEILGTATLVAGTIAIALDPLDIPSAVVASACITEAWLSNTATGAGVGTIGAKYVGVIVYAAGPPASATLTINAQDGTGALVATSVGTIAFRVLIPRNV